MHGEGGWRGGWRGWVERVSGEVGGEDEWRGG